MILVDANVLIYAYHPSADQHQRSKEWLEGALESGERLGLAWITVLAFLRVTTSPKPFSLPLTSEEASATVTAWLSRPAVSVLSPTERHWLILSRVLADSQCRGPLVMDAHLAALAIEHGATLCTTDRDFTRFKGLRLLNPLE
ncbi:MAG TPA: type II toxin-antitoxin system VapC family toxin [Bryobacteraceae bacterium]|nr:type II toxin-antitoxin system VapC family toxin [Bryobacteraceae bacterium]